MLRLRDTLRTATAHVTAAYLDATRRRAPIVVTMSDGVTRLVRR